MTTIEEVNKEANNGEKGVQEGQESVDAKDQKSNLVAEKIESLSVNEKESNQEKDESKPDKEQECDEKDSNNLNKDDKKNQTNSNLNLLIRIMGFTRLNKETDEMKLYYNFFTNEIGISAPLVEMSARIDDSVIFQLKSEDDKKILLSKIKKRKIYKWKKYTLEVKGLPNMSFRKDLKKFPLDEALKLLYPYKEIPYGKQLKEKTEISKDVIHSLLPKKQVDINVKPIVPMTSAEGYDYHVPLSIELESETKRTICGIRMISADKRRTCIVPIEMCPSVPHQMALVAKDFVDHMSEYSFTPVSQKTSEGNILGIILQMTQSGNFIMTMVVPATKLEQFKQLSPNGVDGDVITIKNFSKIDETRESMIEKAENYFKNRGKDHGIMSVYMSIINRRSGLPWSAENTIPDANHILGDSSIPDYYNGQQIQVTWTKDYLINNSLMSILNVIQEWGYISSSSSIYLSCNHKIVSLYLAKKVENLVVLCSSKRGNLILMKAWAKKMGLNKIEFIDLKGGNRYNAPVQHRNTAIIWHTLKKSTIDSLLSCGVTNIIFVSYWTKDPPSDFININKEPLAYILQKLEISNIFPIDIAPYTHRFCLLIFLRTKKYLLTRKRSYDSLELERIHSSYFPYEAEHNRTKRLKGTYF